jgi:hypothetical protein
MPNNRLFSRRARFSSFLHHAEPSHALLIRNNTASHRRASLVECALPTLAGSNPPFGVKVQEQVVPALGDEPIAQRNGW